jgi:hypothetical protein
VPLATGDPRVNQREVTMAFVQIIDMTTTKFDEIQALEDEWRKATEGKRTLRRSIVGRDRNNPDHYLVLAFFDDYDSAMKNSNLPETSEFGRKQGALCNGPMQFIDLDVIEDV